MSRIISCRVKIRRSYFNDRFGAKCTLVSRDGIVKVLTIDLMASMSSIQKYNKPEILSA